MLISGFSYGIFDCDGVIRDSMGPYARLYAEVLTAKLKRFYKYTTGTPVRDQIALMFSGRYPVMSPEEMDMAASEWFRRAKDMELPLFEGAKQTLERVAAEGIKICITSGANTDNLQAFFQTHELPADFFLGSDVIKKGPEHIVEFAKHFGVRLEDFCREAFYVGDGPPDMAIGKAFNICTIGITTTVPEKMLIDAGGNTIITTISELVQ